MSEGMLEHTTGTAQEASPDAATGPASKKDRTKKELGGLSYEEQSAAVTPEGAAAAPGEDLEDLPDPASFPPPLDLCEPEPLPEDAEALEAEAASGAVTTPAPAQDPQPPQAAPQPETKVKEEEVTGLLSPVSMGRFVTAAKAVETEWTTLTTEERAEKLGDAAADELKAVGVPETTTTVGDLGTNNGQFDFGPWSIALNEKKLNAATADKTVVASVANTTYHEARHGEQWHRMARIQAGAGKDAATIAKNTGIKPSVVADAVSKPLSGDSKEATEGKSWNESVYGSKAAHRQQVYADKKSTYEAQNAKLAIYKSTVIINNKAVETYNNANQKYNEKLTAYKGAMAAFLALKATPGIGGMALLPVYYKACLALSEAKQAKASLDAALVAYNTAKAAMATPKTEYEAAYALYKTAFQAYLDLPEEIDARVAGEGVKAAYLK
ncbi:MAG: hypothetical protein RBU45_16310 [Myxococcota bacterium]|jgi:hypothetical protein|nr:hypothetical protein [Myxococcota bacterium]